MINEARDLILKHTIRFLKTEAEYADIRDIKVAADIINSMDKQNNELKDPTVVIQTLASKLNIGNPKMLFHEDV